MTHTVEYHETNATPSQPGPLRQRLGIFVGEWHLEGHQFESPFGSEAHITASETFEWVPGEFFLLHRMNGKMDGHELACVEIIEFDAAMGVYELHTFYNDGSSNDWEMRERIGQWITTGASPGKDGASLSIQCTTTFRKDGNARTSRWEYSADGAKWDTFWETTALKLGS